MNQYQNIPAELRQRMQWVSCGADKKPLNPRTGALASVKDPSTWGSFDEAVASGMRHIGFVFTAADPYCGIDIDDKVEDPANEAEYKNQQFILHKYESYTERSVGDRWTDEQGRERGGYHIIIRGKVDYGRDFAHVGVYSTGRFFTFTGDVVRQAPIIDYQDLLNQMVAGMPAHTELPGLEQFDNEVSDADIHEMARNAANGEKYDALCACTSCVGEHPNKIHGTYRNLGYESQSHADLALLSIIAFYTRDNAQVRRIFRCTGLGKRAKATQNDVYLNRCLRRIRAGEPSQADLDQIREDAAKWINKQLAVDGHSTDPATNAALAQDAAYLLAMGADPGPVLSVIGLCGSCGAVLTDEEKKYYETQCSRCEMATVQDVDERVPTPPRKAPAPPAPKPKAPAAPVAKPKAPSAPPAAAGVPFDLVPPGLVGEVAQYIYSSAVRPVREVALTAAIGFVAGIAGRCFNISSTGLNQYLLLVARTGTGKEDGPKGVERLLAALRPRVPMVDDFIGPGAFASGQALIRVLDGKPSFVSILGEFGKTMRQLNDPRAPAPTVMLKKVLLDLYAKSGWNNVLRNTAYSDHEKNTKTVYAPNVSFFGDTTPEDFYDNLSTGDISDGLIPRLHIVEYKGGRPKRNKNNGHPPDNALAKRLEDLVAQSLTMQNNNANYPVQLDAGGLATLDAFDIECDERMSDDASNISLQLWNRAHLKALKLSALLAVGVNPDAPVITQDLADWAIAFTVRATKSILQRFDANDVGSGDGRLIAEVKRMTIEYFALRDNQLKNYRASSLLQKAGVLPYAYYLMRSSRLAAFANDRRGSTKALRETLDVLLQSDQLFQLPKIQAQDKFQTTQALFYMGRGWALQD
jgi:hypothetical protein